MSAIAFYITGHGFGHAVRSHAVIVALKRLAPELSIHVRTTAPQWLFHDPLVFYSENRIDIGIVQSDSLEMDLPETVRAWATLRANVPSLIERELDFLLRSDIRLIVGDIPPLAFEIAARASIPSVAISNFTWNWIYRAYLERYPAFLSIVEQTERFYGKATLALALPYADDMDVFPKKETIPWVTRRSSLSRQAARAQLGLPQSAAIVLLSFGGLGLERLPWDRLQQMPEYLFIGTGKVSKRHGNLLVLPEAQRSYVDLVRAADVIIAKPGYGIVADVIAHQTRILFTERGDFPEYAYLVQALKDLTTAEFIAQNDLLRGAIEPHLARLLARDPHWPAVALNGAEVAAEKIVMLMAARPS